MDSEIHIKTCIFEDYKQLTQELKQRGALNFPFKEKLKYLKCVGPLEMQVLFLYLCKFSFMFHTHIVFSCKILVVHLHIKKHNHFYIL